MITSLLIGPMTRDVDVQWPRDNRLPSTLPSRIDRFKMTLLEAFHGIGQAKNGLERIEQVKILFDVPCHQEAMPNGFPGVQS